MDRSLFNVGLYTVPEAARLIRISPVQLGRWMFGHTHKSANAQPSTDARLVRTEPVTGGQFMIDDTRALSFLDLLDARLVKELRGLKISLQAIRLAARNARHIFGDTANPFALRQVRTDGKDIFAAAATESGDTQLLDLVKRQNVFASVIERALVKDIDFGLDGIALRWYPLNRNKSIVIDPARSFGEPIVHAFGVSTWTLYMAFLAEGKDAAKTARIYDVPIPAVRQAVRFESSLLH